MKRHRKNIFRNSFLLFILVLFVALFGFVFLRLHNANSDREKIAKIEIDLGENSLENMKSGEKKTKYIGNIVKIFDGVTENIIKDAQIRGRGNINWDQDKKSWQLKFPSKMDILGISRAKKWVLVANPLDPSRVRNDLGMKLATMVGEKYNHRGKFAEVSFDGADEGLFYVLPKLGIEKGSVDLKDELGVLVELDNLHPIEGEAFYRSYDGNTLLLKDAVSEGDDEKVSLAMNDFLKSYNGLEMAAINGDFEAADELADLDSLARYFLVSEFSVNPDAYSSSFYFYKDGENDKIHTGPLWDFDLAFANTLWSESQNPNYYSPRETMARRDEALGENGRMRIMAISRLMYLMMNMPEFQEKVKVVFRENLAGRKAELVGEAQKTIEEISKYASEDCGKWQSGDFEAAVSEVMDWVKSRYDYFEEIYGDNERSTGESVI